MFKKNLWIVALLMVLSFTAFMTTSCVDGLVVEEDTMTYKDVDIGTSFNTWGGQAYQSGWSTDNATWNDPNHTVKNLGLNLDDFLAARYLDIEINGDSLAGAMDVIWGNEKNGWNQTNSVAAGGAKGPVIRIDLTRLVGYANYKSSEEQIRIIIQYNQPGQVKGLVKSATLKIPDFVPFIPVVDIEGVIEETYTYSQIPLSATVIGKVNADGLPATNASIIWSIVSFTPDGGTKLEVTANPGTTEYASQKAALKAKVAFDEVKPADKVTIDYSVYPWEEIKTPGTPYVSTNIIKPLALTDAGVIVVKAIIIDGLYNEATDTYSNFTKDFSITATQKPAIQYKLTDDTTSGSGAETAKTTLNWGGAANTNESTKMIVDNVTGNYTVTYSAGYGNCYHYVEIDLGSGTFNDYRTGGVKFTYKAIGGDANYKDSIRVMAMDGVPPSTYNPGTELGRTGSTGDTAAGVEFDVKIGKVPALAEKNKIYIWFVPWGGGMEFEISGINVYKKDACPCDDDGTPDACNNCMHCASSPVMCDCTCNVCNPPSSVVAAYQKPANTSTEFYLDLGAHMAGFFNKDGYSGLTQKVEANKVTFYINKSDQGVYIPLGDTLRDAVQTKLADSGATTGLSIVIVGTAKSTYTGTGDSTLRYGLSDPNAGSSWNGTNLKAGAFSTILTFDTIEAANGSKTDASKLEALIFHARNTGSNATLEIESIKIVIE